MTTLPNTEQEQRVADQAAADAEYYRVALNRLIDIGMDLARLGHQQAAKQAEVAMYQNKPELYPAEAAGVGFDRVARAVRRTIMLARALAEPVVVKAAGERQVVAARTRIIRAVEDSIGRVSGERDSESLRGELMERLEGPEFADDLVNKPVAEIIQEICRDLGLSTQAGTQPWLRRTPADVVELHERAAKPREASVVAAVAESASEIAGFAGAAVTQVRDG